MSLITRPFKVLGIQQIAIGGPDKVKLQKLWIDMFGLELTATYKSDRENVDEDICTVGVGPFKVEVDLMQPIDPEKKPAVHNTPLNHVGLWIDNLPVAVEWLSQQGVRFAPGGIRKGAAGFDICFIHPKGSEELPIGGGGVLIELVQAPEEVVKAFSAMAAQYA
ncbi:MAG: VOC family protein [Limnohabitans sp.]|nr:VOC family protein [Limnohabitans sp.]